MLPDYSQVWKLISTALRFAEVSAAPTTAQIPTLSLALYAKAKAGNSNLYFKNDAGTEFDLGLATAPAALTKNDDTNVTLTLGGTPATALLQAVSLTLGWTGTLGVARGGTNLASYAVGDILYASGATTLAKLADVAAGAYLRSGGVTTAPLWSTLILPNAATANRVVYASASNTYGESADVTYDGTDFALGSAKRFRMQSQNRTRYLNPIVRAHKITSDQTLTHDVVTAITLNTEDIDTDTLHDNSTNNTRVTAPIAGKYLAIGGAGWEAEATQTERLVTLAQDGGGVSAQQRSVNEAGHLPFQVVIDVFSLAAGGYVELFARHQHGSDSDVILGAATFLALYYIGE